MRKPLLVAAAIVAVAALFPAMAGSAPVENESFGIVPLPEQVDGLDRSTFAIPLEEGATFEDAVRVYNRTDQPIELLLYAADARAGVDGSISVDLRGSTPEGVGAWIELAERELNLPPRGESIVSFRITVGSANPMPDFGAIVVENTARGIRSDLPQRLHVVVRTSPPDSPTTSRRVRPLLLRSPWIIVAILGLIAAALLVWIGARRARRPHDTITAPGELSRTEAEPATAPAASKPILHRLGPQAAAGAPKRRSHRPRRDAAATDVVTEEPEPADERPLLDLPPLDGTDDASQEEDEDDIEEIEEEEEELDAPARVEERVAEPRPRPDRRTQPPAKPPPSPSAKRLGYIPLDEL